MKRIPVYLSLEDLKTLQEVLEDSMNNKYYIPLKKERLLELFEELISQFDEEVTDESSVHSDS
jgi:phosphorylcholine metabolism protein LicD